MSEHSQHLQEAIDTVQRDGLMLPDQPGSQYPQLPSDITMVDDDGLMEYFSELTAWGDFIASKVAFAGVEERHAQRALDLAEATATSRHWTGASGERVAVMKKRVAEDPEVVRALSELDRRHAYRKVIEVMQDNNDRDTSLISRELTRRTSQQGSMVKRRDRWVP